MPLPSRLQNRGRTYRAKIRRPQREQHKRQTSLNELGVDNPRQVRHSASQGNLVTTSQPAQKLSRHISLEDQSVSNRASIRRASGEASMSVGSQLGGDAYAFSPDDVRLYRYRSADAASRPNSTVFSISSEDQPLPFDDMAMRQSRSIGQADRLDSANFTVGTPGIAIRQPMDNMFELEWALPSRRQLIFELPRWNKKVCGRCNLYYCFIIGTLVSYIVLYSSFVPLTCRLTYLTLLLGEDKKFSGIWREVVFSSVMNHVFPPKKSKIKSTATLWAAATSSVAD